MHLVSNNFIHKKAYKQRCDERGDKQQQIFINNNGENNIIIDLCRIQHSCKFASRSEEYHTKAKDIITMNKSLHLEESQFFLVGI